MTVPLEMTPVQTIAASGVCDACEHSPTDHDAIARRYCTATISNAITRGCICSVPGAQASLA